MNYESDNSSYRIYLASTNSLDGVFYLFIVNGTYDTLNQNINMTQWYLTQGLQEKLSMTN